MYKLIVICLATNHFPPSIYDTLSDKNLKEHYEFPDRNDGKYVVTFMLYSTSQQPNVVSLNASL